MSNLVKLSSSAAYLTHCPTWIQAMIIHNKEWVKLYELYSDRGAITPNGVVCSPCFYKMLLHK